MRGGLPTAWVPRCPCSGRTQFATKDNDPSFITDITVDVFLVGKQRRAGDPLSGAD